ncbi:biopolymer transporter ExbD [Pyxidicoccus parkwayensis]|uniref:Biopolymer transporter ExbD n=1 Tax=Pyxidicoccus parkwayensis TaxID=2813578 RepID=A0ABX7NPC5_9BACT|nr:biopolymer transporter ExbD [Pyxidicoccus parkwaysis]QSQ20714.1 biopolymer transporter ExbD [Pyxidicoccus parkwaysis]
MHSQKRSFVKPQAALQSEINVTPLVDVVLVLLIIFMVLTPLMTKDLLVQLPEQDTTPVDPPTTDTKQWVVGLTPEGRLTLNDEPVADADYVPRLKQVMETRPRGQRHVFFKMDDRAGYGRLVTALDGAKAAGAEELGVLTD